MKIISKQCAVIAVTLMVAGACYADELQPVQLLAPDTTGGKPLMQVLKERKSTRQYDSRDLPVQALSDLLWAACGVSRPATGYRTAPTARNMQEIDVYVAMAKGLYLYDAGAHMLVPVLAGDMRAVTGEQPFVKDAPVNLIFVADLAKMKGMDAAAMDLYAATDTGYISENVYLYCASAGLGTVVRGWVNKPALAKAMKLRPDQRIILAQTVGYVKE